MKRSPPRMALGATGGGNDERSSIVSKSCFLAIANPLQSSATAFFHHHGLAATRGLDVDFWCLEREWPCRQANLEALQFCHANRT